MQTQRSTYGSAYAISARAFEAAARAQSAEPGVSARFVWVVVAVLLACVLLTGFSIAVHEVTERGERWRANQRVTGEFGELLAAQSMLTVR